MAEKLRKLYNTMCLIETKGENTKTMSVCLQFVEQLIREQAQLEQAPVKKEETNDDQEL